MVSNRRVLFLYKLKINRIERIHRFKRGTVPFWRYRLRHPNTPATGGGEIHLFEAGGGGRPEVAGKDDASAAQKGGGKWADEVRWKAA